MIALFLSLAHAQPAPSAAPAAPAADAVVADALAREQQILDEVRVADEAAYDKLTRLRATDPSGYLFALVKAGRMLERARNDPAFVERHEAREAREAQVRQLAVGFAALSPDAQAARRAELERLVGELMDLRQEERRARLEELRTRLVELEAELQQRERDREAIVDDYVDQALARASR